MSFSIMNIIKTPLSIKIRYTIFLSFVFTLSSCALQTTTESSSNIFNQSAFDNQIQMSFNYSLTDLNIKNTNTSEVFSHKLNLAKQGDADAQYHVSVMYFQGVNVSQNNHEVLKWLERAASQKHRAAQNILGVLYAQYNLGILYNLAQQVKQSDDKAITLFTKVAESGDKDGQNNLGIMYYRGSGVEQNYAKAFFWFELSANQSNPIAEYNLGHLYLFADNFDRNNRLALFWLGEAYKHGYLNAGIMLGTLYETGDVVEQNYATALKYYRKAAQQNFSLGKVRLGLMYYNGYGVDQNVIHASKIIREAAENGEARAQYIIAYFYLKGKIVVRLKNEDLAFEWMTKSANQGFSQAQYTLATFYEYGYDNGLRDVVASFKWYRKAAIQGHTRAQLKIAHIYYFGNYVLRDFKKTYYWTQKAANRGNAIALLNLSTLYRLGHGVRQDDYKAQRLNLLAERQYRLHPRVKLNDFVDKKGKQHYESRIIGVRTKFTPHYKLNINQADCFTHNEILILADCIGTKF